jgi:hypothetical protein
MEEEEFFHWKRVKVEGRIILKVLQEIERE